MRSTSLRFAALVVWVAAAGAALAAAPPDGAATVIPAQQLRADFAVLKQAYQELHPGLYRYNSRAGMDANFKALEAELSRDLTLRQAYLAVSVFLAKVRCGHSYANFYNQPDAVADALFKGQNRVPFYFRWVNGRMIVTRNFSEDARLATGTEVLAVNGVPARKILARLLTVARADGSNDAKRVSSLEVLGRADYEAFDIYYPLFFPPADSKFELRVRTPSARGPSTLNVTALSYEQRLAPVKAETEKRRGGAEPLWEFKQLDERTAYWRMPTWALYNSKWDWKQALERAFDQLAENGTANLVIDLRGNEGGLSVGDVILSRLVSQDLRLEPSEQRVRYRKVPDSLRPYLATWDKSFFDWGAAAADSGDGFYRLTRDGDATGGKLIKASPRPFAGRTFVLVDAGNSSATFSFAQAVQQNRLATLVGQPTGGNQRGINGGAFFFLRLPNSKIEVDVPLIAGFPPGPRPDAGIVPDVTVTPDVRSIARNVDAELEAVRKLLK